VPASSAIRHVVDRQVDTSSAGISCLPIAKLSQALGIVVVTTCTKLSLT